jgi:hypothetical protein
LYILYYIKLKIIFNDHDHDDAGVAIDRVPDRYHDHMHDN